MKYITIKVILVYREKSSSISLVASISNLGKFRDGGYDIGLEVKRLEFWTSSSTYGAVHLQNMQTFKPLVSGMDLAQSWHTVYFSINITKYIDNFHVTHWLLIIPQIFCLFFVSLEGDEIAFQLQVF